MRFTLLTLLALLTLLPAVVAQPVEIAVTDEAVRTIPADYYGIQYHRNTYNAPVALAKLEQLPFTSVRIWAYPRLFNPAPDVWDWSALDREISEVVAAGYAPIVCLFQGEDWRASTADDPWWNDASQHAAWTEAARALAARYADEVDTWILYDEINYLHTDRPYYFPLNLSATLYLDAARAIRDADPSSVIGGPSGFSGWENGYWAARVLSFTDGPALLDFVSSNLFLSWNGDDSDATIMGRTIWYEEAPLKIRTQTAAHPNLRLMLDAYNVSALWTDDGTPTGNLWTDPRNVDTFGGVVQTAALLHAAQGGFDITLRWETLGGFGVLRWYPAFEERAPYYAWQLLAGPGRLMPGSTILRTTTTAEPLPDLPHHSGMNVHGYDVQPFAVEDETGVSIVLLNKTDETQPVAITRPDGMAGHTLYRFEEGRHVEATTPLAEGDAATLALTLPATSVTVVRYAAATGTAFETTPERTRPRLTVAPNPSTGPVTLQVTLPEPAPIRLDVRSALGKRVATLADEVRGVGTHTLPLDTRDWAAGVYWARLCIKANCSVRAFTVVQ
ncbi:MAG: hypothetical protein AAGG50_07415 [Bacteroidota bacterium]